MARFNPFLAAAVGAGALLCAFVLSSIPAEAALETTAASTASDVPIGIRIGIIRIAKTGAPDRAGGAGYREKMQLAFADTAGNYLYSPANGADCTAACSQKWKPALAMAGARPAGDWTLAGPSKKQWTFQGKLLYWLPGAASLNDVAVIQEYDPTRPPAMGDRIKSGDDGMQVLLLDPASWTKTPFSIGIAEYRMAPGQILAAGVSGKNQMGTPLYMFSGTSQQEQKLPGVFKPQYAAALDLPIGDFTIRDRADGSRQWLFRGAALYTCTCDLSVGDLNGKGLVPGMAPAVLVRYPTPVQIGLRKDVLSIGYLTEAKTGKTLYYRDRLKDDYTPDHARPMLGTEEPTIGTLLNTKHCDAQCEKDWHPLLAPANAQPQGYWSIYLRADGKHQWAYKNCAVYTHAGERPGTLDGNEAYKIAFNDGTQSKPVPEEFGLGLAWRALVP